MKFPKNADIEEYKKAIQAGAIKGGGLGIALGLGAAYYLKRRTSFFVGAGGFQRMLVYAAPAAFCSVVNMELSSRDFEEHMRLKQHGKVPQEAPHKNADVYDRAWDMALRNKYKFVVGGWAASLAGSFWIVNRDKYMTKAQKVVQARVYAQAATVMLLLLTVALGVSDKTLTDKQRADEQSKSWERDIEFVETANHPHGTLKDRDTTAPPPPPKKSVQSGKGKEITERPEEETPSTQEKGEQRAQHGQKQLEEQKSS